jgi:GNAT superfamily N-acetyltransferase
MNHAQKLLRLCLWIDASRRGRVFHEAEWVILPAGQGLNNPADDIADIRETLHLSYKPAYPQRGHTGLTEGRSGPPRISRMADLRIATQEDVPAIRALIADSVRVLSRGFYSPAQAESALQHVFGVDSQLIIDASYYVIEDSEGLAAAGGWSRRMHLYGGDQAKGALDPLVDPVTEAARIRAFFVAPRAARRGMARRIYEECVSAARTHGFTRLELVATMPGVPLYTALGFEMGERYSLALPDGVELPVARMTRGI